MKYELALRSVAAYQIALAIINLAIVPLLGWRGEMEKMPLLMRQVFHVHKFFLSFALVIFAVMTWRFAPEMAVGSAICAWLAAGIGLFWATRVVLQVTYYSASHWRERPLRTAIHIVILLTYGAMALIYLLAAKGGAR